MGLQSPPMKSYEVIREAVNEPGVKAVAAALRVSPALVYKWCEPPADSDDPDQSGAKNPLDRVREMYMLTKDIRLVRWLCNEAGGFFVANPDAGMYRFEYVAGEQQPRRGAGKRQRQHLPAPARTRGRHGDHGRLGRIPR